MTKQEYLARQVNSEDALAADTHRYINNNYPELRGFYLHIPNESATNSLMRVKLFAMGILPGAPDFLFLKPYTWFLEIKMPNGALSPKQKELHKKWREAGMIVETAYSKDEIVNAIKKHITP